MPKRTRKPYLFASLGLLGLLLASLLAACGDTATPTPATTAASAATTAAISATTAASSVTTAATSATTAATSVATTAASAATTAAVAAGPKTKIVFWSNSRHDLAFMKDQVAAYNTSNKDNIEVEYVVNTEDYPNLLELAWQSKQGPDLIVTRPLDLNKLTKAKFIEPLDSYLTPDMKKLVGQGNFTEGLNVFDGKVYSLPNYGSTFRLIYNKDLFKKAGLNEPPKTMGQMVEYARKLTEAGKAEGAYGFAINLKTPSNAWNRTLIPVAYRSGFNSYDFKTGQFNYSVYKPFLQSFRQMVQDGSMFPSYQSLDIDPLRSQFAEGKIGMYMSISAEAGVYANQFKPKIEWAAAPVPTLEETVKGASLIGRSDWIAMSGQSKNKEASWKVMQWFYRQELLTKYHEEGLGVSVLPEVVKTAKEPTLKGTNFFLPDKTDANWPVSPTISKVEGKKADDVFAEYVIGVNTDLDKALNDLNTRYNKALNDGVANGSINKVVLPNFDPLQLQAK